MDYKQFLDSKRHLLGEFGFEPIFIPDIAFDFQRYGIGKACVRGRNANFYDTGLGKTLMQISIAYNIALKTDSKKSKN